MPRPTSAARFANVAGPALRASPRNRAVWALAAMGVAATWAFAGVPARLNAGDLVIEEPWARTTPGGATVGAGYLKITNAGSALEILTGGSASVAERVEVHEMTMADGVMRMRPLARGLEIKPGAAVELSPGGTHLMFLGLGEPLQANRPFKATLNFKNAGAVEVEFSVRPIGAEAPRGSHH